MKTRTHKNSYAGYCMQLNQVFEFNERSALHTVEVLLKISILFVELNSSLVPEITHIYVECFVIQVL